MMEEAKIESAEQARSWIEALDLDELTRLSWRKLHTFSPDHDFTRDLVADLYCDLLEAPEKLVGKRVGVGYLITALHNRAKNHAASARVRRGAAMNDGMGEVIADGSVAVEEEVVGRVSSIREARAATLLVTGLKPQLQEMFALDYINPAALTDAQIAKKMKVSKSRVRSLRQEVSVQLQNEYARLGEGLLCRTHLESDDPAVRRGHLEHCTICAGNLARLRALRTELRAVAPASLLVYLPAQHTGGFFAHLLTRFTEPITAGIDFIQRRYQEASALTRAGAVVVAVAAAGGGATAVVQHQQDEKPAPPPTQGAPGPTSLVTPIDVPPVERQVRADDASEPARPNEESKSADADQVEPRGTDAPALAPEGSAHPSPVPSAPAPAPSGARSDGGSGDLAP